jgi:hypothetical protein
MSLAPSDCKEGILVETVQKGREADTLSEALHYLDTDLDRKLLIKQYGNYDGVLHRLIKPITMLLNGVPALTSYSNIEKFETDLHVEEDWLQVRQDSSFPRRGLIDHLRTGRICAEPSLHECEHSMWLSMWVIVPDHTPHLGRWEIWEDDICGCDGCRLEDVIIREEDAVYIAPAEEQPVDEESAKKRSSTEEPAKEELVDESCKKKDSIMG